jgi:hypothetical protein
MIPGAIIIMVIIAEIFVLLPSGSLVHGTASPAVHGTITSSAMTTAALVGRDGFVTDLPTNASPGRDAPGAPGSGSIHYFETGGNMMENSKLRQVTLECLDGAIILTPVSKEEFLMILTDTPVGQDKLATGSRIPACVLQR